MFITINKKRTIKMTKMYKRLLAMVLAVLMVLSMAACGGDSQAPAQETKTTTPAAADAPAPSGP